MAEGRRVRRWLRFDLFDAVLLVGLAGLAAWTAVVLQSRSGPNHLWIGVTGPFIGDQLQYLGWIEQAARHVLVGDPFRSGASPRVYLHPGLAISGVLVRAGLSPSAAYLAWEPLAVAALFASTRAYVRRLVRGLAARRAAMVVALFVISPTAVLAQHVGLLDPLDRVAAQAMATDLWPGLSLWGYPFTVLAVAALPAALLWYASDRRRQRVRLWGPLAALTCSWLQPWQGATLVLVLVGSEAALWLAGRRAAHQATRAAHQVTRQRAAGSGPGSPTSLESPTSPSSLVVLTATVGAGLAPLAYYAVLSQVDPVWRHSGQVNLVVLPWLPLVLTLAPFVLPAALALRIRPRGFTDVALRVWPLAGLATYGAISVLKVGTFPLHALQGLSIPLAVLGAIGVQSIGSPRRSEMRFPGSQRTRRGVGVATAVVTIAVCAAALAWQLDTTFTIGQGGFGQPGPYYLTAAEHHALVALRQDPAPGPVLASVAMGEAVPAETGRRTWVGIASWTPNYRRRVATAAALFSGGMDPRAARRLVVASHARFLLATCADRVPLRSLLGSLVASEQRYGCVRVLRVASRP